jgi:hypothetical protein
MTKVLDINMRKPNKVYLLLKLTNDYPWRECVRGICRNGDLAFLSYKGEKISEKDSIITWNYYGIAKRIAEHFAKIGCNHYVVENGYINASNENKYFSIAKHLHLIPNLNNDNPSRWEALGIDIKPWKKNGSHVLVCGQRGGNHTEHFMPLDWPQNIIQRLRKITDRPIWYRPHPARQRIPDIKHLDNVQIVSTDVPLEEHLNNAHAVVVYSSNAATNALLNGVPAFYEGKNLTCAELSLSDINKIEQPMYPEREEFFQRLAWAQWNLDEIKSGEAWAHYLG